MNVNGAATRHGPLSAIQRAPIAVMVGEAQAVPVTPAALPLLAAAGRRRRA